MTEERTGGFGESANEGESLLPPAQDSLAAQGGQTSDDSWPGERQALQSLIKDFRDVAQYFEPITKLKPGAKETLDQIGSSILKLPSGESLSRRVEELRKIAGEAVLKARMERTINFRRIEGDFVRTLEDQGALLREIRNDGWRIGPLELQVKPEQAQCRWLYNHEQIVGWTAVAQASDLQESNKRALSLLSKQAIEMKLLVESIRNAYESCARRQGSNVSVSHVLVSLDDLYREFRVELFRRDMAKASDGKPTHPEFPKWAFLHNLDRYTEAMSAVFSGRRISFQTGSQQESQKLGMAINGLDAINDYHVVCYAISD